MVFFGDSRTPSEISHVTVCSAEFIVTFAVYTRQWVKWCQYGYGEKVGGLFELKKIPKSELHQARNACNTLPSRKGKWQLTFIYMRQQDQHLLPLLFCQAIVKCCPDTHSTCIIQRDLPADDDRCVEKQRGHLRLCFGCRFAFQRNMILFYVDV